MEFIQLTPTEQEIVKILRERGHYRTFSRGIGKTCALFFRAHELMTIKEPRESVIVLSPSVDDAVYTYRSMFGISRQLPAFTRPDVNRHFLNGRTGYLLIDEPQLLIDRYGLDWSVVDYHQFSGRFRVETVGL